MLPISNVIDMMTDILTHRVTQVVTHRVTQVVTHKVTQVDTITQAWLNLQN